jgi:hypothetical protein
VFMFCPSGLVSTVPRAPGPVFMFCAPGLAFDGTEGVRSSFHVLRSRTHFRWNQGRRVHFSCFALPDPFLCTEGVGSHFHILRSMTHYRRYRGRRVQFSCFALSDSFSALPREPGPVFMFCAFRLIFGGTEGNLSSFYVLRS